jgi:lysophospholipase L1-like esterase
MRFTCRLLFSLLFSIPTLHAADEFLPGIQRIVFLGDSITYAGDYVHDFELFVFARHPERKLTVINAGLPSETVSGLSEDGHADGRFLRPDLHERLGRVLGQTEPDLVFACYGMNDGIYLPLDEARFARFHAGIERLRARVTAAGAAIIHLTPPTYHRLDARPQPGPDGRTPPSLLGGYNLVLDHYSAWLMQQRSRGWRVIDLHGPMNAYIEDRRKTDPGFVFAHDGIHANAEGHALMADQLIASLAPADITWWRNFRSSLDPEPKAAELRQLIRERGKVLCDAYLDAAGHQRPEMKKGLPVAEAEELAAQLEIRIRSLIAEILN